MIKLLVTIILVTLGSTSPNAPVLKKETLTQQLAGTWSWRYKEASCIDSSQQISFNQSLDEMYITYKNPEIKLKSGKNKSVYRIQNISDNRLTMKIEDEERTDPSGNLVVWDLVLLSPNNFCWYRHDWPGHACTSDLIRCD